MKIKEKSDQDWEIIMDRLRSNYKQNQPWVKPPKPAERPETAQETPKKVVRVCDAAKTEERRQRALNQWKDPAQRAKLLNGMKKGRKNVGTNDSLPNKTRESLEIVAETGQGRTKSEALDQGPSRTSGHDTGPQWPFNRNRDLPTNPIV